MTGVNKTILIGNLGQDPELKYTNNGTAVVNFSIAINEEWKDQKHTEWVRIVAWNKVAENCSQYLTKGRQVYVEGKLQTRKYEKDGQTHYITEVVAQTVKFLGSNHEKPENEEVPPMGVDEEPPF